MKTKIVLLLATLIAGCSSLPKSEQFYPERIVGSWILMDHGYRSEYVISLISFTGDGRKCVVSTDYNLIIKVKLQRHIGIILGI